MTAPIAISVGCPSGVGPEVAVAAAASFDEPLVLVGDAEQLSTLAARAGVSLSRHAIVQPTGRLAQRDRAPGKPTAAGGAAQLAWVDAATDLVSSGKARALVTGPVSKEAIAHSGAPGSKGFRGHTEHLQKRLGASEVVMAFWHEALSTSLVTTHLPLKKVPRAITAEAVARSAYWLGWLLARLSPGEALRVAVSGLNPHAGEGGLLGDEEVKAIGPGIKAAQAMLRRRRLPVELVGPLGAESAFRLGRDGAFGGVVAMYHDQATIPMKLLGFGEAVNVSLGLPIVRTSVDHGTAYDRAGRGEADATGMRSALSLAHRLTGGSGATAMSGRAGPGAAARRGKLAQRAGPLADGSPVAQGLWHPASPLGVSAAWLAFFLCFSRLALAVSFLPLCLPGSVPAGRRRARPRG